MAKTPLTAGFLRLQTFFGRGTLRIQFCIFRNLFVTFYLGVMKNCAYVYIMHAEEVLL